MYECVCVLSAYVCVGTQAYICMSVCVCFQPMFLSSVWIVKHFLKVTVDSERCHEQNFNNLLWL